MSIGSVEHELVDGSSLSARSSSARISTSHMEHRCLVPPTPSSSVPVFDVQVLLLGDHILTLHRQPSDSRNRELDCRDVPLDQNIGSTLTAL